MRSRVLGWSTVFFLSLAAWPSAVSAAGSTGLYEPFPSPDGGPLVQRYVGALGVRLPSGRLARGAVVGRPALAVADPVAGAASRRSGAAGRRSGWGLLGGAALALALVGAIALAARRARGPEADPPVASQPQAT
jgi:hypothetical protein